MNTKYFDFKDNYKKNIIDNLGYTLQNGAVGIFPTDTVYGFGCNAFDENAIKKLYKIKFRNYSKPMCILVSNLEMLNKLVENISEEERKLIDTFWPGALTIIFKKKSIVSDLLTANLDTVGIRMPNNQIALDLISASNIPLATTSSNISGETDGTNISDFLNDFNNKVDFIIDNGNSHIGKASTIVQIIDGIPKILREGSISKREIEDALKK